MRERNCESMRIEDEEHRRNRLERQRDVYRRNRLIGEDSFQSAINVFADVACSICKKILYPMQRNHRFGILTSNSVSIAIACHQISGNIHYWLFDSHARGPKGNKASTRGKACCMHFVNTRELFAILRRNLRVNTGNGAPTQQLYNVIQHCVTCITACNILYNHNERFLNTYSITPVSITIEEANHLQHVDSQTANPELLNTGNLNVERVVTQESLVYTCSYKGTNNLERRVILSTSLLYSIDEDVPNLENIVNTNNENQFDDHVRVVDIQRKTAPPINIERERRMEELCWYFFFPDGKNGFGEIRDIAITALDYFQARIMGKDNRFKRNDYLFFALSVVEYFKAKASVSVSCRMKQGEHTPQGLVDNMHLTMRNIRGSAAYWKRCCAELIAMVRSLGPPTWFLTFSCNDLNWPDMIKALLIADGRPDAMPDVVEHLPFDERLELVEKYPVIVARQFTVRVKRLQTHKHSATCYKDRNAGCCRFGFPRAISATTKCLEPDDALRNNGRFCEIQRNAEEVMINNYNATLLKIWDANMDVQPCGTVTAVAYYIAKYASKCEPNDCGEIVREAVRKAKRHSNDVWKQLFTVSMAILIVVRSNDTDFCGLLKTKHQFSTIYVLARYQLRPDDLEGISLAEFAVRYETVSSAFWNDDDGDIELRDHESESTRYIRLRDNSRMRIRNQAAVLRTRYYTLNSDREGFYYSLIVCHIPFSCESELILEDETAEACFLRRQSELRPLLPDLSVEQFAHAEQVIQQALVQAVALDIVNQNDNPTEHNVNIYAEDQINVYNHDDFIDENNDPTAMPDEVFVSGIRSLNVQQKDLMKQVSDAIERDIRCNDGLQPLLLFITGGAGSGKSFLLKLIVEHIRRCYAPTVDILLKLTFVEVASLTGVAARQISGRTLHSDFSLPIEKGSTMTYRKMSGQPLERERRKWRYIKWLVVDEISMVSYENLRIIHLRLQEFKNNNSLFGGINILLFGDIMQLPPVKGHWCFEQPPWSNAEIHLWQQFSFCELTINMRQSTDVEFIDLLNNLRFGELTLSQLQLLCERRQVEQSGEFADGAAVRIFPTLKLIESYNSKMTDQLHQSSRISTDESREVARQTTTIKYNSN
ncbi:hypothetical protein SFRURICE_010779 [Spodoptera frugiperda]|nr:hypothetical protein SFRURICE_010779 [Spodoptera frugiperda]